MGDDPEIAVVIGAYRRQEYLERAVDSVLAQSVPRASYEVVVTKDFSDPAIDRFLANAGVATLLDGEPLIGRWLLRAVHATHAPLIAFLDDDDEFEPDRLARVLEVFRTHPEVGFYRNRVRTIGADGTSLAREGWRPLEVDEAFDRSGPVLVSSDGKDRVLELVTGTAHASFNSSTMVVRREILEGDLGNAFEVTQLPDLALFVTAVASPYALYFDDRRLTRYRFYGGNVTHRVGWLRHAAESHASLVEVARARGREDLAQWLALLSAHYDRLFRSGTIVAEVESGAPKSAVAQHAFEYLRFLGRHPAERGPRLDVWAAELYALAYLLLPTLCRRVALSRAPVAKG